MDGEIKIGQWIEFKRKDFLGKDCIEIGFVTTYLKTSSYVKVCVPKLNRTFNVPIQSIIVKEEPNLEREDIDAMIDLALSLRDWEWLKQLRARREVL